MRGKHKRILILEPYNELIEKYLFIGINLSAIHKIISYEMQKDGKKVSYTGLKLHILRTDSLNLLLSSE